MKLKTIFTTLLALLGFSFVSWMAWGIVGPVGSDVREICEETKVGQPLAWPEVATKISGMRHFRLLVVGQDEYHFTTSATVIHTGPSVEKRETIRLEQMKQLDLSDKQGTLKVLAGTLRKRSCHIEFTNGVVTSSKTWAWD